MYSLLQCLICSPNIIHWHCDLNSSLLSTAHGDIAEGEKAALGSTALDKMCLTSAEDIFGEKTTQQTTLGFCCFNLLTAFLTLYVRSCPSTDSIQADIVGFLMMVNVVALLLSVCFSLAGEAAVVVKLFLL